jgi:hypothetical protein
MTGLLQHGKGLAQLRFRTVIPVLRVFSVAFVFHDDFWRIRPKAAQGA